MHLTGPKIGALRLTRIVSKVEVERKFNLGPNFASVFLSEDWTQLQTRYCKVYNNQGGPSFIAANLLGEIICDIYYDIQNGRLSTLGLWVRQRQAQSFLDYDHGATSKVGVVLAQDAR
ncbi:hypothetical protein F4678DRAFT_455675 [Xylaria arbuscula]|nr:hypothetical protein F4678DRAFT_455675 [Xylaria arbuscula]